MTTPEAITETKGRVSRRGFLTAGAGVAAGVVFVACSSDSTNKTGAGGSTGGSTGGTASTSSSGGGAGDAPLAAFAAGLELFAVDIYKKGLDAATAGSLGPVPPAVAEFAKTAMSNHQAAAEALNKASGLPATPVAQAVQEKITTAFGQVKDIAGLAALAKDLEESAASTYLDVLPKLQSKEAIGLVGSILPIERQHVAILNFALGMYPVPETFATTDQSLAPK